MIENWNAKNQRFWKRNITEKFSQPLTKVNKISVSFQRVENKWAQQVME